MGFCYLRSVNYYRKDELINQPGNPKWFKLKDNPYRKYDAGMCWLIQQIGNEKFNVSRYIDNVSKGVYGAILEITLESGRTIQPKHSPYHKDCWCLTTKSGFEMYFEFSHYGEKEGE